MKRNLHLTLTALLLQMRALNKA